MNVAATIIPIFAIIILGWLARRRGFLPPEFLGPANRLVYHIAIPAMIFNALSRATLTSQFSPLIIALTLISACCAYGVAWLAALAVKLPSNRKGTFIQCAGHGNLGYIGLAVAFYFMGESGLTRASIVAGFLMIVQNLLSVIALQAFSEPESSGRSLGRLAMKIMGNPVILSAIAGILFSSLGLTLPLVVQRSLEIVSGMALPTALLLIGATLSFKLIRDYWRTVLSVATIKLGVLPAIGLILFRSFHLAAPEYTPALILLAAPTATIAYVMAGEMQGDPDAAVATISAVTLLSALTLTFWLHLGA
ncbi:MAG: AEC family transporter [Deltaproteobacteria bacterium]|nr:MAG: AEC family transporter [Deltaproteobacteria bacterium]RUA03484.1 MAG: AEC family transporter [Deltaproteobacteria bacterium]